MNTRNTVIRNTLFSSVGIYTEYFLGMLTSIIIARHLGPAHFGAYSLVVWLVATGVAITNSGVASTVIKFVAELRGSGREASIRPLLAWARKVQAGFLAVVLLAGTGRIAGISNIAHGLVDAWRTQQARRVWLWRLLFLLGMVGGSWAWFAFTGRTANPRADISPVLLIMAGLLVGYGTSLSNGCTSGHGVCGLGRLSLRSLAATGVFMVTGIATVFVTRHLLGL